MIIKRTETEEKSTVQGRVLDREHKRAIKGVKVRPIGSQPIREFVTGSDGSFYLTANQNDFIEFVHPNYNLLTVKSTQIGKYSIVELDPKTTKEDAIVNESSSYTKPSYKAIGFGLLGLFVLKSLFYKKTKNVNL